MESLKDRITQGIATDEELLSYLVAARSLQGIHLGEYGLDHEPSPTLQPNLELVTQVQEALANRHPNCLQLIRTFEQVSLSRGYDDGLSIITDDHVTHVKRLADKDHAITELLTTTP